jgi:uncharacterized protein
MWITALILGFAGSMHCLGMCSPLVMAVTSMTPKSILNRVVYNSGRILTYASMGAVVSSAGLVLPLHEFQNIVSIALGIVLLLLGIGGVKKIKIPGLTFFVQRLGAPIKNRFAHLLKQKKLSGIFALGALNGLLPCGLTAIALTWCVTLRGPADGFNFMLIFGAGTLPVMLGFTALLPVVLKKINWSIHKLSTGMLILSGCLLIARVFLVHVSHAPSGSMVEIIMCK